MHAQRRHDLSCYVNALWIFGNTYMKQMPHLSYDRIPEIHPLAAPVPPGHDQSTRR
jgi:hypothetical protein